MDEITMLSTEIKEVKADVTEIKKDLKELLAVKHKFVGGIKVIAIAASVCAFIFGTFAGLVRENRSDILKIQQASREFGSACVR